MNCNLGNLDRLLRLIAGVGLFLLPFASGWDVWQLDAVKYGTAAIGGGLALTSSFRFCPVYRILGLNTCRL
ncbi:DUF2892 domain-containing protein [Thalassovita sp.]|uniref:YgaP family membrane protein n=1 Tax=Thalassovita sp. TaxID=1979401 RepID=UPI0029DE6EA5|nr:DUF2892 domain-containing protein [Thalassovita sp.]